MNFLVILRASIVIILTLVEPIISARMLSKDIFDAPLVLKKKQNSSQLELAIPCKYLDRDDLVSYFCKGANYVDEETEEEPEEAIMSACPALSSVEFRKEEDWKKSSDLGEDNKLLFLKKSDHLKQSCDLTVIPSIKKADRNSDGGAENCGQRGTEIYDVGYPVTLNNEIGKDIEFMSIYQICYSVAEKATRYSIHRIVSPSLLLRILWKFYDLDPTLSYQSHPVKGYTSTQYLPDKYENYYAYQLVGFEDMPVKVWKLATLFSFNYIFIPKHEALFEGIIAVDNYIRLYSKVTNQPLTIYSGVYQAPVEPPTSISCAPNTCVSKVIQGKSLWRIIMNDKGRVAIIVTQYSSMKCDISTHICPENSVILREYKGHGCTYKCLASENVFNVLGLPALKHSGELSLTIDKNIQTEARSHGEEDSLLPKYRAYVDITDFLGKVDFMEALRSFDHELASTVKVPSEIDKDSSFNHPMWRQ